jgi:hypothetical protein
MLHCYRAGWLTTVHVKGDDNVMADIASRPAKAQKLFCAATPLFDRDFLASFDTTFPLPDEQKWEFAEIPPWLNYASSKHCVGGDWHCNSGWDQTRALLAGVDDALSNVRECHWLPTIGPGHHGQVPHVCCCRAGRKVRPRKSGQGSVSPAGSPARRLKARSGRTSQPTTHIPSTAFPQPPNCVDNQEV